jgi:hypothetical protein
MEKMQIKATGDISGQLTNPEFLLKYVKLNITSLNLVRMAIGRVICGILLSKVLKVSTTSS